MKRIACIGEAMIELSMDGSRADVGVAGDTLNTAVYMRRAAPSLSIDYMTCLGDDPFSNRIQDFIGAAQLGTQAINVIPGGSPGLYAITTTPDGERSFTYWRSAAAARQLFSDGNFDALSTYDAIYFSGISVAILPQEIRQSLINWLNQSDVTFIYDSNYRPRLWESQQIAQTVTRDLWKRADIALPSIDDEMALFNETEDEVAERFVQSAKQGALKRGASGPISLGETVTQEYPAAAKVVDTTAAGDSFNAGYLGALLTGKTQAEALMSGHMLAAKVVQHRGAIIPE